MTNKKLLTTLTRSGAYLLLGIPLSLGFTDCNDPGGSDSDGGSTDETAGSDTSDSGDGGDSGTGDDGTSGDGGDESGTSGGADGGGGDPDPECGNGVVEAGEECDDGNNDNTDGCTNDCLSTQPYYSNVYTTHDDFGLGTSTNVEPTGPGEGQLQISQEITTFPFMWIANAGEDTVSKIDTNTGAELARYRTTWGSGALPAHGAWSGPAPSRTAVDLDGNVYVANRNFDGTAATIMKIRAVDCEDTNGVPGIQTSTGGGDVYDLVDNNANNIIDAGDDHDECIEWLSLGIGNSNGLGRSLAIDNDGDLWLGLYNQQAYYEVSAADGSVIGGPYSTGANRPYGAVVDQDGILWGAGLSNTLLKLDTNDPTNFTTFNLTRSIYGIAIGNGKVYGGGSGGFVEFDPVTETSSTASGGGSTNPLGISVDILNDIVVGAELNQGNRGVTKFRADGSVVWTSNNPGGPSDQRGCIVDSNNDIWTVNRDQHTISKFGEDGTYIDTYPVGREPYTYSDATGLGVQKSNPTGRWSVVEDTTRIGTEWCSITWNTEPEASEPAGTTVKCFVRSSDDEAALAGLDWIEITSGQDLSTIPVNGQYLEIMCEMKSDDVEVTPILSDIRIGSCCLADADDDGVCVDDDNCPNVENPDQVDSDGDGQGDACDECPNDPENDADGDGLCADEDPCPDSPENDADGDGLCGDDDPCPDDPNNDSDGDGICDSDDPCPDSPENDADGDGLCGDDDPCPNDPDNDIDCDGMCADVDPCPHDPFNIDWDGDGVCEEVDNCPYYWPNPDQSDRDGDGCGDVCDLWPDDPSLH